MPLARTTQSKNIFLYKTLIFHSDYYTTNYLFYHKVVLCKAVFLKELNSLNIRT